MADPLTPPPRPPAEPKFSQRTAADFTGQMVTYERPARWQTAMVVLLGIVLVAVPLYLWRRPRSATEPVGPDDSTQAAATTFDAAPPEEDASGPSAIVLGDPRVLECHDTGATHIAPERCDHLVAFEKALAETILDARDCVPASTGGGTITYVTDLVFTRRKAPIVVSLPREGRSIKNPKTVAACTAAVRRGLSAFNIDDLVHAHTRYRVGMSATYPTPK